MLKGLGFRVYIFRFEAEGLGVRGRTVPVEQLRANGV